MGMGMGSGKVEGVVGIGGGVGWVSGRVGN